MAEPSGNTINLKWNHRGVYHRFEIPREAGCSTLMERITTIFPNFYGQIGWKDEDGDTVIISSDEELMHAASLPQNQQLLRLFTIDKGDDRYGTKLKSNGCTPNSSRKKQESSKGSPASSRRLTSEVHSSSRRFLLMAHEQILNTQKLFRKSVRASSSDGNNAVEGEEGAHKIEPEDAPKLGEASKKRCDEKGQAKEKKNAGSQPHLKSMFSTAKRKITGDKSKKVTKAEPIKSVEKCPNKGTCEPERADQMRAAQNLEASALSDIKILTVSDSSKNDGDAGKEKAGDVVTSVGAAAAHQQTFSVKNADLTKAGEVCDPGDSISISSDSDIEIIEKCDQARETGIDDWTFVNPTGTLQENNA